MDIIMFGTGNANAIECYNTCFMIKENDFNLMVDGGGGNEILKKLKYHRIDLNDIHNIFLTHVHTDHLFGVIWIVRMIGQMIHRGKYQGILNVYACDEAVEILDDICKKLLPPIALKYYGKQIKLKVVNDGEIVNISGKDITFFDLGSNKIKQYGFSLKTLDGKKITCLGDVPYEETSKDYVIGADVLMHEAFCLESEVEIFSPYEKNHSTVKEPSQLAESFNIPNLILYHTVDNNYEIRKNLYMEHAKFYYSGNVIVPNDDETITF